MRTFHTAEILAQIETLGETDRLHIYNGLDCCVTLEVFKEIRAQLDNVSGSTYEFSRSLQAPFLDMMLRGFLVDEPLRQKFIVERDKDLEKVEKNLRRIAWEAFDLPDFNFGSWQQVRKLFYEVMALPEVRKKGKVKSDRAALEKLRDAYFHARPLVEHILFLRDLRKMLGVLRTEVDTEKDGSKRMRCSINIAGTETGRASSSRSVFDTGTNMQNITEKLRRIFIADPGKKIAYMDLEQAENKAVGAICWNLFGADKYLNVCESSDVHTNVAKLVWKNRPWTGDKKHDRKIAEEKFYRHFSFRDMAKRGGHASNYGGHPSTISGHLKVPRSFIESFQREYFSEFPEITDYHQWCARTLQLDGYIQTPTGRRRYFFGRRTDDATVREAIAYSPQEMVAYILNSGILNIYRYEPRIELLEQEHDAVVFQYPEEIEDEIIPIARNLLKVPVELKNGRVLIIPNDVKTGWNWANSHDPDGKLINPDGLMKYSGHDNRKRTDSPSNSLLDRRLL